MLLLPLFRRAHHPPSRHRDRTRPAPSFHTLACVSPRADIAATEPVLVDKADAATASGAATDLSAGTTAAPCGARAATARACTRPEPSPRRDVTAAGEGAGAYGSAGGVCATRGDAAIAYGVVAGAPLRCRARMRGALWLSPGLKKLFGGTERFLCETAG